MAGLRPLSTQNSQLQNYGQLNDMIRKLNKEQQVKTFNGPTGEPAVIVGKLPSGEYGIYLSNGTVTTTITAERLLQNDGSNDRVLMGDDNI